MNQSFINEIHYNDIPVSNLEQAIAWYSEILGLQMTFRNEDMAIFKLPSGPVLIVNETEDPTRPTWRDRRTVRPVVGFLTDNIAEFHADLTRKQIKVTEIRDEGMGLFFEFYDLDDNYFAVIQYP